MKKIFLLLGLAMCFVGFNLPQAQNTMWIYNSDGTVTQKSTSEIDKITVFDNNTDMLLFKDGVSTQYPVGNIDSVTFSSLNTEDKNGIYIHFTGDTAIVYTSIESESLTIDVSGADVNITSKMKVADLNYYVYGTSTDGSLTVKNDKDFNLILSGLSLTSQTAVPVKSSKEVVCNIILADGTYNEISDTENNAKKPVISTSWTTNISGKGILVVNANKKNGISCDADININNGDITVNINADAGKGIKADSTITIYGGNINCYPNGNIVLEEVDNGKGGTDPSYCAGISSDQNILILGGTINMEVPSTALAARGIKADGDIFIFDGTFNITNNANGGTYTDSTGTKDSYKASCIKADGDIYLTGGTFNLTANGSAGKCVTADGDIVFGYKDSDTDSESNGPAFTAATTGKKILVTAGSGWEKNADYSNPKAVKAKGNLYVYGGNINITTQNDGGEGLESKDTVFIDGGIIVINAYDDAINAKNHIRINGGTIYARGTGNDGIDCNGTMEINGGVVIAVGSTSPEEGFDCDNNQFKITGGLLIGVGGSTSQPTPSVCTQNVLIYKSLTKSTAFNITDANGNSLAMFQVPVISGGQGGQQGPGGGPGGQGGNKLTLLFSSPSLVNGTYSIIQGGTISEGTEWNGYYENATYTGGTSTSVTVSSVVTTKQ